MLEIKQLGQDRWRDYRNLRLEALETEPLAFGKSYSEEEQGISEQGWKDRIRNMFFAASDGKPIGMAALVVENNLKTKHIANIYSVFVGREYRGRGVGKSLLECVVNETEKNKDITKIKLSVNTEQTAAIRLYQSCGFEIVGRLKQELCIDGKFYDEFMMEKYLSREDG
jgi:ribosomal protein S18 acetylase RimI-like enzyme